MVAFVADVQVVFELAHVQQLAAALILAADPQAFRLFVLRGWPRPARPGDVRRGFTEEIAHCSQSPDSSMPSSDGICLVRDRRGLAAAAREPYNADRGACIGAVYPRAVEDDGPPSVARRENVVAAS